MMGVAMTSNIRSELTTARIKAIHGFWKDGMTSSDIADVLSSIEGQRVTRAAVIGIYHRNSDAMKDVPLPPPSRETFGYRRSTGVVKVSKPRVYQPRAKAAPKPKSNVVPFVQRKPATVYVQTAPTKMLYQLESRECRWPMSGDGAGMQFCAQETTGSDVSYCEHHYCMSVGPGTKFERGAARALRRLA